MTVIRIETSSADPQQRSVRGYVGALSLAVVAGHIPPSVDLPHLMMHGAHLMAPTCGLGRAGRAMLRLEFMRAISFNPAIVLLVAVVAVGAVRELVGRRWRRWLILRGRPRRASLAIWAVFLASLAAWQQYRFHFLVSQRL